VRHGVFHSTDTSKRRFIGDKRRLGAGHVRARMHVCACEAVNESLIKAAAIFPVVEYARATAHSWSLDSGANGDECNTKRQISMAKPPNSSTESMVWAL
jgi:hypothetical protein